MAIVKMSEFDLLVRNDHVESLLFGLQRYKNVMFADKLEQVDGFNPLNRNFNFKDNQEKQDHIQSILKKLALIKKKESKKKGQVFDSLNLKTMSFDALQQIVTGPDLDSILDMYAEYYESASHSIESYTIHTPWDDKNYSSEKLMKLENVKPSIFSSLTVPIIGFTFSSFMSFSLE